MPSIHLNVMCMRIIITSICMFFSLTMSAQETVRLDSTSFYSISGTAFGKAIVYAQRNVQLKKEGNYHAKVKDGELKFTLNKNAHVDGDFYSKDIKSNAETVAKYVNGTQIYERRTAPDFESKREVSITKKGTDYLITKTKMVRQDSTVEKYVNQKPLLKEKYINNVLVIKNNIQNKEVNIYGRDGKLWERHFENVEEKYSYDGTVSFKKVFLKDRIEEYRSGKLSKLYELQKDKPRENLYDITTYDQDGHILTKISETNAVNMIAPEYMFFDLSESEFESYKAVADLKR